MGEKQGQPSTSPAGDTYDLAVGLRRRLAEAARPEPTSVTSQLQTAARERLASDRTPGRRAGSRFRSRRISDDT